MFRSIDQHRKKIHRDCRMKATFRDKNRAAHRAKELTEETGNQWRYYECLFGRHYHLTSH